MQRRGFFASIVAATALGPFASRARPENLWRIGYLTGGSAAGPSFEGFCKRMAELGYVEGSTSLSISPCRGVLPTAALLS